MTDDIDEIAVKRLMAGDPVQANTAERREAVRRLTATGMGVFAIADLIGTHSRTIQRDRAQIKKEVTV